MGKVIRGNFKRRGSTSLRPVRRRRITPNGLQILTFVSVLLGLLSGAAWLMLGATRVFIQGDPSSVHIRVLDGDTVETSEGVFRLVGYNTPELHGDCTEERALAQDARDRLEALISEGKANLRRVPCACAPGIEGTDSCNFGRFCGVLTVNGRRVEDILIGEGLAEPYHCRGTSCPRRRDWCR
jgi:endonuclease YncB( thermonuclease family)